MKPKKIRAWAWVHTDDTERRPIISIDETRQIVTEEKRATMFPVLGGPFNTNNPEVLKNIGIVNRKLYKNTRVVPVTITYSSPIIKRKKK